MIRIGALPGHSQSQGIGLNENGEVVGVSFAGDGSFHAFHWTEGTGITNLGVCATTLASGYRFTLG
jgi:probable HAF family extracellular repeat protein